MTRVAIIGAGPCGLSQLQAFARAREKGEEVPELVCFEKQSEWGGLWNYTWRTGLDEHGSPVHGGMYRYLWSNGPKECLEFGDYSFDAHFGKAIPSFPPREVLRDYLIGRARAAGAGAHLRTNTEVQFVSRDDASGRFRVRYTKLDDGVDGEEDFDYVVVATGHFSVPNVPEFEGIERFPGRVMHAHDYRDAREFAGRRVLVVGASYSAEDIALQSKKYGARSVTISYRTRAMGFRWPEGVEEVALISRFDGSTVHFRDGSTREIDAVVLCTGYLHHFPFLENRLRLRTHNRLFPGVLYKGVALIDHPKLLYLGMQDQYYTFSMFDAQAWYARDVIMGKIALPSKAEMEKDAAAWQAREEGLGDPIEDIDFQTDYCKDLCARLDYGLDFDVACENFKEWEHHKEHDILTYRDRSHPSPVTGTRAPLHHTPWWEAMDDSRETFLATR